ncbi:MAG: helix-turn-helix domain-containing protein, partial [Planctomycetes bacterium]|nr:helix-turn-helix domain-containing protein [Planctomycetota bacterium]
MKTQNTPGPKPTSIQLSGPQSRHLDAMVNRRNSKQGIVKRAKIILMAAEGSSNAHISREIGLHEDTARQWRGRWAESQSRLDK